MSIFHAFHLNIAVSHLPANRVSPARIEVTITSSVVALLDKLLQRVGSSLWSQVRIKPGKDLDWKFKSLKSDGNRFERVYGGTKAYGSHTARVNELPA
jgi:hypothetical protein